jgi:hypothetical protein
MKKILKLLSAGVLMSILCVAFATCESKNGNGLNATRSSDPKLSDAYYWLGDEKIPLERIDGKYFVMFLSENEVEFKNELARVGVNLIGMADGKLGEWGPGDFKTATIEVGLEKIKDALPLTFYYAPYYRTNIGDGKLGNRFSVSLKKVTDLDKLENLAKENSVEMLGVSDLDGWYELACTNLSKGNALEMGNLFYETGLFESVGYDLGARGSIN